jgi:DNA-binding response OmpR family regulator
MTRTVLVIEDDPDITLAISMILRRGGFSVDSAADGQEGLRAFVARPPDVVVLDLGLPVLDGWAVLERIRDLGDRPVLLLTAHSLEAGQVHGLRAAADDYMTKPFGNDELLRRVRALLPEGNGDEDGDVP